MIKLKCPMCGSENVYIFDKKVYGSLEMSNVEIEGWFCCEDCEHEEKLYISGKVDWNLKDLKNWI